MICRHIHPILLHRHVAVIFPGQHKYVVDAQTLGFSWNDYANEVSKSVEARVCEEDALYLPAVIESFG